VIALRHSLSLRLSKLALAGVFAFSIQGARAESSKVAEQAGATLFRDKGCTYCHGASLEGTHKGPSLQQVRKTMKAQQIIEQIKNGGQKMPSFEDSLSSDEISELVAYLRAKHRPSPAAKTTPDVHAAQTSSAVSNPEQ
jgi:mono/diheme cytochrome c family protein